jgi:hypothetical protein
MKSIKSQARRAGLLYFVGSLAGPFSLLYVPSHLIVSGDATATANHLRASESLLRAGMAGELFGSVMFIFIALALYHLFRSVDERHAVGMATLLMISIPISILAVLNELAALGCANGAPILSAFDPHQLDALAYLFMRLHGRALVLAEIFFGVLVLRSGFIPRILGVLLLIAGVGYLADSLTTLVLPAYADFVDRFSKFLTAGELPIIFWLLIWGVRIKRSNAPITLSAAP